MIKVGYPTTYLLAPFSYCYGRNRVPSMPRDSKRERAGERRDLFPLRNIFSRLLLHFCHFFQREITSEGERNRRYERSGRIYAAKYYRYNRYIYFFELLCWINLPPPLTILSWRCHWKCTFVCKLLPIQSRLNNYPPLDISGERDFWQSYLYRD